ncbi:chromatin modification-related eaf3 [Fusarium subglutinans]|uniref:Chromatin modification-related protein EAF3 n=1 Tax=Gibberella subglutinans TaxID=42677 RepID=A0A8H5V291_GIBSU|nr:chromatin modification-related eaf3 [Fusarium subglutinans]KAF5606723.1 chromatin modification-related eaf3 [Fusarium subglutinans]
MAPARQQPAPPPFSKDEKVLCFHMDMLYEAKIMDVQLGEKPSDGYKYKVHYKGWKNTWDDWVLVDRIRPFDDEHKELAAQLHAQLKHNIQRSTKQPKKGLRSGAESARVSEERSGSATVQGGRGGRRGKDWELEQIAPPNALFVLFASVLRLFWAVICKIWPSWPFVPVLPSLLPPIITFPLLKHLPPVTPSPSSTARHCGVMESTSGLSTPQGFFPASDAQGSPALAQPDKSMDSLTSKKVKLTKLKEIKDHLTFLPSSGHRYVTESGKLIHDDRYAMPLTVEDEPKQPRQKPQKPSAKPKPRSCDQLETEDAFHNKPMIKLPVPDHIQAMLVDDWENITKNNQLVPLPHNKPVTKIFEDYLAHERPHREEGSSSMDILEEVVAGFREYFEKALSRILLYRFERHQHMELKKLWENTEANPEITNVCDVYGAEHLARLIVSLPELLAQTNMDQQSVSRLREEIGKFNVWLGRNCETYFVNEYETPSQEYIDKARSF